MINLSDYPSLLNAIRKRPMLYHGGETRSIDLLSAFIGGIAFRGVVDPSGRNEWESFDWNKYEAWVNNAFNTNRLALNSFSLAAKLTNSQEEGFDLWFSWYCLLYTSPSPRD